MKIIGLKDASTWESSRTYIAEISHREIKAVFDKTYGDKQIPVFDVGTEVDISQGHKFRDDIQSAYGSMLSAMKAFEKAKSTLLAFASMLNEDTLRKAAQEKATEEAHGV